VWFGVKRDPKKLYPVLGVKQLTWYLTPGMWGISVAEAETAENIANNINVWRIAKPGIFKSIKTELALEIVQLLPLGLKLSRKVKE